MDHVDELVCLDVKVLEQRDVQQEIHRLQSLSCQRNTVIENETPFLFSPETDLDSHSTDLPVESLRESGWKHLRENELTTKTVVELRKLRADLSAIVEDVSSELVKLLEERQNLQDEVDIRNIAIEQLWKVQGKLQWRFTETQLGIQMGVTLPSDSGGTIDCL